MTSPGVQVSGLWRYPVKGMAGEPVDTLSFDKVGPEGDRRWMLVNPEGRFLSQRRYPALSGFRAMLDTNARLTIRAPDGGQLLVREQEACTPVTGTVWQSTMQTLAAPASVNRRLSQWLGTPVRLVRYDPEHPRFTDPSRADHRVGFADGFPLLICHQASLDAFSRAYGRALDIRRFRPNVLVNGSLSAWAENVWEQLANATIRIDLVKSCTRCVVITGDPDTGERSPELLRLLYELNAQDGKPVFGRNGVCAGNTPPLSVGTILYPGERPKS